MTLAAVPGLFVALVVVMLPGVALLLALRVRRLVWVFGAAPAASIGVATATAILCALLGVPFGPVSLGVVVALLLGLGVFWWWRSAPAEPGPRPRRVAIIAGAGLGLVGIAIAVHTWMLGLAGSLSTLPQEHDTIVHTLLAAYIQHTGHGAPWQLLPADLLTGQPSSFYPSGMHLLAAVTGGIMGDSIVGFNAVTVMMIAVVLPMSVGALAYVALTRLRAGVSAATIGAGVAAIVAAGMNQVGISLAQMGGIMANATSLALTPGVVAVLLLLRRRDWLAAVAAGVACAGVVAAHPSGVVSIGVTLVAWLVGEALSKGGPRRIAEQFPSLLVAGVTAGVLGAATLLKASSAAGVTTAWGADFPKLGFPEAFGQTFSLPFMGYIPAYAGLSQTAALALAIWGIATILMSRRGFGPVIAYLVWSIIVLGAYLSPNTGFEMPITSFFYNAMVRIRAHQSLLIPVLAAVGVVLTARAIAAWLARRPPLGKTHFRVTSVSVALVVLVMLVYVAGPGRGYARIGAHYLLTRYGNPELNRVTTDDQAAFNFLVGKVGPGERVMNSANDGSTFLYVEKNIPVVNVAALGVAAAPYTYKLMQRFNTYRTDPVIRKMVLDLNITWVYVDYNALTIGAAITPENWVGAGTFTLAPGLANLQGLPGLTEQFRSGAVHVYRLDLEALRKL